MASPRQRELLGVPGVCVCGCVCVCVCVCVCACARAREACCAVLRSANRPPRRQLLPLPLQALGPAAACRSASTHTAQSHLLCIARKLVATSRQRASLMLRLCLGLMSNSARSALGTQHQQAASSSTMMGWRPPTRASQSVRTRAEPTCTHTHTHTHTHTPRTDSRHARAHLLSKQPFQSWSNHASGRSYSTLLGWPVLLWRSSRRSRQPL
jgi:hypothetical protein